MTEQDSKRPSPAYVPYRTFTNFINILRENGVPSRIDRGAMHGMSGSTQAALKSTLEYLALIDAAEHPTAKLKQLVDADDKTSPAVMLELLRKAYPYLLGDGLDLAKATSKQVEEAFRGQGISGSTIAKAMAFFLNAAKAADIKISPYIKAASPVRPSQPRKQRAGGGRTPAGIQEDQDAAMDLPAGSKNLKLQVPGKGDFFVVMPESFDADDWEFLKPIFHQYMDKLVAS